MSALDAASQPDRIRDLPDEAFAERYGRDRFTAAVIVNRMRYLVEHMSTGLREAFSPIIRDWYDFACTISGQPEQGYPMAVVSNGIATFLGSMADAVANTVEEYGAGRLALGDVLICNDPSRSGTHVNDILFIRPVFTDGRPCPSSTCGRTSSIWAGLCRADSRPRRRMSTRTAW